MNNVLSFPSLSSVVVDNATQKIISVEDHNELLRAESAACDLPFVEALTLSSQYGEIDCGKGLFVNGQLINKNIVSKNYEIVQPVTVKKSFERAAREHNLVINTTKPNFANGGLLLSAKYDGVKLLGEDHDVNLVFYTAHDGRYKTFMSLDILRIACFNQLPLLYKGKSRFIFNEKHYHNPFNEKEFTKILCDIPKSVEVYNELYTKMEDKPLSRESFVEWFIDFNKINTGSNRAMLKVEKIKSLYNNASGQSIIKSENVRKAANLITYLNTHDVPNTQYRTEAIYLDRGDKSLKAIESLMLAA